MKKEDVISAGIMTIVSVLVLVGFTVAWFSNIGVDATGMHLKAAEMNNIIIALEEGGEDISTLGEDARDVDMGLQDMTNVEQDKLAPGQFGQITFYVRPSDVGIEYCDIIPQLWISQSQTGDTYTWYPGEDNDGAFEEEERVGLEALYQTIGEHIQFFKDEEMTIPITERMRIVWEEEDGKSEKPVTIYWKWYYEYPFTEEENETLSDEEREVLINKYDGEDTEIGNNITAMKFHFSFSAQ